MMEYLRKQFCFVFLGFLFALGVFNCTDGKCMVSMVDPAIDESGPFCYLSKPNTTLAVMAARRGSQMTFDGAIYTGAAELCFFYGNPLQAVMVRQKTLYDGWMPIILYSWNDGNIQYQVEAFAATLDGIPTSNSINFVRVVIHNQGETPTKAHFAAATRFSGFDHRFEHMRPYPFSADWKYQLKDDSLIRDGKLLLLYPTHQVIREAVPGEPYQKEFVGKDYFVSERAEVGMVRYEPILNPGQEIQLNFKFPHHPVPVEDLEQIEALRKAEHDAFRQSTIDFWNARLALGTQIDIPEQKVMDVHRASLMYDWIAVWTSKDGQWVQGVNKTQYNWFWLRDGAYIIRTYDMLGHHDVAEKCLEYFRQFQKEDGLFASQEGQTDGFGQALFALGQHSLMTGNLEHAREVYEHFPPALEWLKQARAEDPLGLMPATEIFDNEFIHGHLTGHNFWALLGVRTAARVAQKLGYHDDARDFLAEYKDFHQALMKVLDEVCGEDGAIPPGLDEEGGQDWGNLIGVYPTEVLQPFDPRVSATLDKMRREKYQEGIMTYKGRLHHYLTIKSTQNFVVRGEQEKALEDFYHFLLHTGSTHEAFEWETDAWGARDVGGNFPPHGWGSAMYNALLRNMLVQERGGNGGLEPREIHLFSVISPHWAVVGEKVAIRNAPTEMGPLSAVMKFTSTGAEIELESSFRETPRAVVFHIPYFVDLVQFKSDDPGARRINQQIVCSPEVTRLRLVWKRREHQPWSFEKVVEDYKREYARRYEEYIRAGYSPLPVEAPHLLTAEERRQEFSMAFEEQEPGIAVGKPVTSNTPVVANYEPWRAVDGNAADRNGSAWWAGGPAPAWLQIDLENTYPVHAIQVFPYWDWSRYYQYLVEVSLDGESWTTVADMSRNTRMATGRGDLYQFDPLPIRFVRVTMLYNSANPGLHLVEVKVFADKDE